MAPTQIADVATRFDLGPIDQVSFAINDLDAALPRYTALFGDFVVRTVRLTPDRVRYRGRPMSATLALGFARSGDVEIELVQVLEGDAPSLEHLRDHGEGLHHVRFRVADIEERKRALVDAGYGIVVEGTTERGSSFAYLEAAASLGHTVIELIQPPAE
jgi:catechol 2,3-dioxygenase-like lactoylglutathione lyase family enzyme